MNKTEKIKREPLFHIVNRGRDASRGGRECL